ncbi:Cation-independent mannose-6-phosphate receptor CI-MPR [Recurvomyces mirabilis]|uniref:Cation-independent mannose-6-phosphate receptor CI-MPR n=1 Tax=Recurvomyces mirabilis TaxID=574656 RepID=A0AAE0TRI0_9PEZI|nr:Cation-independent mannose-6-phosphate receptor CI-MPR [Recurvomyces mirabilis]KAK5150548.1 Cation-independent mannose-6-phosphate receptor CI-MPR [Recurvomyces mirabilis]
MMNLLYHSLAFYLTLTPALSASHPSSSSSPSATATKSAHVTTSAAACTIRSPNTHAFFDLNPLHLQHPEDSKAKHPRSNSWNASGYDLGYNFTMNFCGSVIEDLSDKGGVVGVEKAGWGDVGAYYEQGGKIYSLGQMNDRPIFRGRKLVMNYTDGSPCGRDVGKREHVIEDLGRREIIGGDDDDDDDDDEDEDDDNKKKKKPPKKGASKPSHDNDDEDSPKKGAGASIQRKSTIISFLCDRDPLSPLLTLSFISASPDECTYVFEARSSASCSGIETAKQTLSPSGVFGVIVLIAVLVYLVGGCVYSRMVLHQRGWQQLPNYGLWAAVGGFLKDIFIILTSSCTRLFPSRRGYTRVNGGLGRGGGNGRGRGDSDAENRLIDELNEEWDD